MTDGDSVGTILVVGGGPAGLVAIHNVRKLDAKVNIILVEPKDYCEVTWATFRTPFDEKLADESLLMLEPWVAQHNVTHFRQKVTQLEATACQATLEDQSTVKFDTAVLCTGATSPWTGLGRDFATLTKVDRLAALKAEGDRLLNAGHVCVVGGGLVGVELAGDLRDFASEQGRQLQVTLVHSGPYLCHTDCKKATGDWVQSKLESNCGVRVVLNERAVQTETGVILQKSGETIAASQVVMTIGNASNLSGENDKNSFFSSSSTAESSPSSSVLNEKGLVTVDEYFCVRNGDDSTTLLAVGDCCNFLPNAANQIS